MEERSRKTYVIQTSAGTDVEFRIAGVGGRSYAFIIDWHFRFLLAIAWFIVGTQAMALFQGLEFFDVFKSDSVSYTPFIILPSFAIYFLYHPIVEVLMHGNSPGKRTAKVRVLTVSGDTPSVGAILIRNIFRLIDSLPMMYAVGIIAVSATRNSVRIGDLAAGTILVYEEGDAAKDSNLLADYGKETGLSAKHVSLVREWLQRAKDMHSEKAVATGNVLYQQACKSLNKPFEEIDNSKVLTRKFKELLGEE